MITNHYQKTNAKKYESFRTTPPIRLSKDPKQILGLIGGSLLFLGVSTPIINYPVVGSLNTFQHTCWAGPVLLILAVISIFLSLTGRSNRLWFTGLLGLATVAVTFINIQLDLAALRGKMTMRPAGKSMSGLADKTLQSIQIQWGWALLVVRSLLLLAFSAWKEGAKRRANRAR
jgi:hypothetical protein